MATYRLKAPLFKAKTRLGILTFTEGEIVPEWLVRQQAPKERKKNFEDIEKAPKGRDPELPNRSATVAQEENDGSS